MGGERHGDLCVSSELSHAGYALHGVGVFDALPLTNIGEALSVCGSLLQILQSNQISDVTHAGPPRELS